MKSASWLPNHHGVIVNTSGRYPHRGNTWVFRRQRSPSNFSISWVTKSFFNGLSIELTNSVHLGFPLQSTRLPPRKTGTEIVLFSLRERIKRCEQQNERKEKTVWLQEKSVAFVLTNS
ncbi:unnamed protein product, partial [Larinioides sclopetarius]